MHFFKTYREPLIEKKEVLVGEKCRKEQNVSKKEIKVSYEE